MPQLRSWLRPELNHVMPLLNGPRAGLHRVPPSSLHAAPLQLLA